VTDGADPERPRGAAGRASMDVALEAASRLEGGDGRGPTPRAAAGHGQDRGAGARSSHDLRTPLTAITAAAEALADPQTGARGPHRPPRRAVRRSPRRLAKLVDDLLDLSRIEAGAVDPQRDWVDLATTSWPAPAGRAARGQRSSCRRSCRSCAARRPPSSSASSATWSRTRVKFSPEGHAGAGHRAAPAAGRVTVRVIDRGPRRAARPGARRSSRPFLPRSPDRARRRARPRDLARLRRGQRPGGLVLQSDGRGETAFAVHAGARKRRRDEHPGPRRRRRAADPARALRVILHKRGASRVERGRHGARPRSTRSACAPPDADGARPRAARRQRASMW